MSYQEPTQNQCGGPPAPAASAAGLVAHELLDLNTVSTFATWMDTALYDLEEQFRCFWTNDSLRRQLGR